MPKPGQHAAAGHPNGALAGLFVRPERSTRWDWAVAAGLVVAVLTVVGITLSTGSAARAEHTKITGIEQPVYGPSTTVPTSLTAQWEVPNTTVGAPIVSDGNVFTTTDDGITAWEAGIGNEQWSYTRPARLCAANYFSDRVVTVFAGRAGCSDATSFTVSTGDYASTRQSVFAPDMTVWTTYSHMLVLSSERVEIWRDDLVRTVEYGHVDAPQEKDMQPRTGCTIQSAALANDHFAVTEACPDNPATRLTIATVVPEDSRKPEVVSSTLTGFDEVHLIGLTESDVAVGVARAGSTWTIEKFAPGANPATLAELGAAPTLLPSPATVAHDPSTMRWTDGTRTYVFDARTGDHTWLANNVSGPGWGLGYRLSPSGEEFSPQVVMLPGETGLTFADARSGEIIKTITWPDFTLTAATDDAAVTGISQIGNIIYVQQAGTMHVLSLGD